MKRSNHPKHSNRREFLQQAAGAAAAGVVAGVVPPSSRAFADEPAGRPIVLRWHPTDAIASAAPVQWAIDLLAKALGARGLPVRIEKYEAGDLAPDADIA